MDPHPSNFMVSKKGEMVYFDFGMMADITPKMQRNAGLLIMHTYHEDVDAVVETIKRMSYLEDPDLEKLSRQVENMILEFRGASLEQKSLSKSLINLARGAAENGVYMPTKFIMIGKGLVTMEGIGLKIYPDFEFDDEYEELVKELVLKNSADPEKIAESFITDFVENKDLLTKLPSKINKKFENNNSPATEIVHEREGENLLPPALILGSLYMVAQGMSRDYITVIGALGILVSLYLYKD
jgi:ubiquinone biosynthesis protein